jgi:hypothetical protein
MTPDGKIIVTVDLGGYVYYALWNGSNYSTFIRTGEISVINYIGICISADGSKIVYSDAGTSINLYLATWDGTNYNNRIVLPGTPIITAGSATSRNVRFSPDGNVIYYSVQGNNVSSIWYSVWNGTKYTSFVAVPSSAIPTNLNSSGLCVGMDNSLYLIGQGTTTLYKTTVTIPNYKQLSNIYTVPNNNWNHYTWQLQTNGIYNYFVNGNLVYTISGMLYPNNITRNYNYIGKSSNLPIALFNGYIDEFRVYNKLLSNTEILILYNNIPSTLTN